MFLPVEQQLERIREGAVEVFPEDELVRKLERSLRTDRPLTIKQGFDPTRPDLHIGHAVSLAKLRTFQELGHQVVFVMGTFTARIGDPSGRDSTRPMLTPEEIDANRATYEEQVYRILDPDRTTIRANGEWLDPLKLEDVLRITSEYTVARMLERDDFAARYADQRPIRISEFLYPLMQGYDSVVLEADVELGGTDQKFNLLVARTLQERAGQEPQACVILPLLRGTDGDRKMSKSFDNYVGLAMEPSEMFGRTMSIPDTLLAEWIELASGCPSSDIPGRLEEATQDPLGAKRRLAADLVARYHSPSAADEAREAFDRVHREGAQPAEMEEATVFPEEGESVWIAHVLKSVELAPSTSQAVRLVQQGAVRVDGEVVDDRSHQLAPGSYVLQRGKRRFIRVHITPRTTGDSHSS